MMCLHFINNWDMTWKTDNFKGFKASINRSYYDSIRKDAPTWKVGGDKIFLFEQFRVQS